MTRKLLKVFLCTGFLYILGLSCYLFLYGFPVNPDTLMIHRVEEVTSRVSNGVKITGSPQNSALVYSGYYEEVIMDNTVYISPRFCISSFLNRSGDFEIYFFAKTFPLKDVYLMGNGFENKKLIWKEASKSVVDKANN